MPEVQEALAAAFRLLQERKGRKQKGKKTESGPIKVNQDEKFKKADVQIKLVGCSPSPVSSPPGRGDDSHGFWFKRALPLGSQDVKCEK